MVVIDDVFCLDARVIYKRKTLSVVTLERELCHFLEFFLAYGDLDLCPLTFDLLH